MRTIFRLASVGAALALTSVCADAAVMVSAKAVPSAKVHALFRESTQQRVGAYSLEDSSNDQVIRKYVRQGATDVLDRTFGIDGAVTPKLTRIRALALQADGKLLVVGNDGEAVVVMRLDGSGAPDASYGDKGVARLPANFSLHYHDETNLIRLRNDGRLYLLGFVQEREFKIARLDQGGHLDESWCCNGVYTETDGTIAVPKDGLFLADGRFLIVGAAKKTQKNQSWFQETTQLSLIAYGEKGRDWSFGSRGLLTVNGPRYGATVIEDVVPFSVSSFKMSLSDDGSVVLTGVSVFKPRNGDPDNQNSSLGYALFGRVDGSGKMLGALSMFRLPKAGLPFWPGTILLRHDADYRGTFSIVSSAFAGGDAFRKVVADTEEQYVEMKIRP